MTGPLRGPEEDAKLGLKLRKLKQQLDNFEHSALETAVEMGDVLDEVTYRTGYKVKKVSAWLKTHAPEIDPDQLHLFMDIADVADLDDEFVDMAGSIPAALRLMKERASGQ